MSSFTPEQVSHFRQVFSQFSDEDRGGVDEANFLVAIQVSLEQCHFPGGPPSQQYLENEFNRLASENDNGVIQWQQFFQVLIHLNLRQSASPPPPPSVEPQEEPRRQSMQRVQFSTEVAEPIEEADPPPPSYDDLEQEAIYSGESRRAGTLGRQFLRSVGGFFGLTQESQQGNDGTIGWREYAERNIEEENTGGLLNTLSRRSSLRLRVNQQQQRPPSYPAIAAGHSFDLNELGGDSDDENGLTEAPPPMYFDVIETGGDQITMAQQQHYPQPTHPAGQPPPRSAAVQPQDLIYDQREAWDYYLKYCKAEKRIRNRRHQTDAYEFFGSADEGGSGTASRGRSGSIRRDRLNSSESNPVVLRRPKRTKRTKLQRQSTFIRREVESLPTFWPVFIVFISVAQVIAMIVLLPIYGLAPIDVFPQKRTEEFPSLLTMNATENITYFRSVNLWIGHTPIDLIRLGAKFTPCMRTDFGIRRDIIAPIREMSFLLGCCQNQEFVGTILANDCGAVSQNFNQSSDRFFEPGIRCSENRSRTFPLGGANFHPCCISITGLCRVMDEEECIARGGFFHSETDSCDRVNCFRDICGFDGALIGEEIDSETGEGDPLSAEPQQFWRFFTATYLHLGVIHFLIIIPIQLYVGIKIERTIGWLRILIIYTLSGVGGNLLSAIFIPYGVNAGASGAVFGLLGVLYVELFQFWQIVDRAWLELIKLTAFVVFLLALGTLPYVDNMAHIGGLLFGVPSAIIFVPYLTFGKLDAVRKRILLVICVPLVIVMFVAGFLTFFLIPTPDFCFFCHYINCVPYSADLCPQEFSTLTPNATFFSL